MENIQGSEVIHWIANNWEIAFLYAFKYIKEIKDELVQVKTGLAKMEGRLEGHINGA